MPAHLAYSLMQPSTVRLLVQLNHARHETVLKVFSFCLCIYLNLRRDFLYGYFFYSFHHGGSG